MIVRYAHVFHAENDQRAITITRELEASGYIVLTELVELAIPEVKINGVTLRGVSELTRYLQNGSNEGYIGTGSDLD